MEIIKSLSDICETKENVNLKEYCTIRIGGIGKIVCLPKTIKELVRLTKFLEKRNIEFYIIGNGSNIVFEDSGVSCVLIVLKKMCAYRIQKNKITAEAGVNLFVLNKICLDNSLSGLEWSYGIPATVGGAVSMNAGAYGGEIKDYVSNVWILSNGKVKRYKNCEMDFRYRKSRILGTKDIVIKATFVLQYNDKEKIKNEQFRIFNERLSSQPYNFYSAGSVFKKLNGESAGKTIDKLGLKSVKIGNIQISQKHANFFVNLGSGTSYDMHNLINLTKKVVFEKTGNILHEEIIFIGSKKD